MSEKMLIKAMELTVKDSDADDRTLEFVGSTSKWDRDDEIILSSAWMLDHYRQNPVVLFAHDHYQPPIGKTTSVGVNKDGELKFKVKFAEPEVYGFADTVYKLYKNGYMKAVSVGLMPLEWEYGKSADEPYRVITKAELYELSMVPVGANPEALITSKGVEKAMEDGAVDKVEMEELVMMLESTFKVKEAEKKTEEPEETFPPLGEYIERKIEPIPAVTVKMEHYDTGMLDSEKFKQFLKDNKLVICSEEIFEEKTVKAQTTEPDIYDILLQDLKAVPTEPHEKSHGEDLDKELLALYKSED
jgi:HK97 family phage prohead protease